MYKSEDEEEKPQAYRGNRYIDRDDNRMVAAEDVNHMRKEHIRKDYRSSDDTGSYYNYNFKQANQEKNWKEKGFKQYVRNQPQRLPTQKAYKQNFMKNYKSNLFKTMFNYYYNV